MNFRSVKLVLNFKEFIEGFPNSTENIESNKQLRNLIFLNK